jgi:ATP-dependent Clp protease ATP-binding subunit ClpA
MNSLLTPKLGFGAQNGQAKQDVMDEKTTAKISRTGVEAARRKFTPEFINRLDKIVVFKPLGESELRRILDIELSLVQQRVFNSGSDKTFVFTATDSAKQYMLGEGTDLKYGARHLKRAIERLLVQPISNLIATDQVRGGDWIRVDFDSILKRMKFVREAEGLPVQAMTELADNPLTNLANALSHAATVEMPRTQSARSSRRP